MPIHADSSPNILWPLPEGKPAFMVEDIFPEDILSEIKNLLKTKVSWGPDSDPRSPNAAQYHTITGRWVTEIDIPTHIWDFLAKTGKDSWGVESLRLKSIWFTRYQKHKGVTPYLWEHMDQPGTQYTMDICIESPNVSWDIIVDGEVFHEKKTLRYFLWLSSKHTLDLHIHQMMKTLMS